MAESNSSQIPLQVVQGCIVASIQVDLDSDVILGLQRDLLALIKRSKVSGAILDLSGVPVIDSEDFDQLRRMMMMAALLGARTVLSGLQPGVVASLVELGTDLEGVEAAFNLDDAFRRIAELEEERHSAAEDEPNR